MKRLFFCFALCLLFSSPSIKAQNPCVVIPQQLKTEGTATITYDPSLTLLKGQTGIKGVYYFWKHYSWEAYDMNLREKDGKLTTTIQLSEDAALLAWKFYTTDTVDVGGDQFMYGYYILDKNGYNMPGANIGWGFLRGETTQDLAGIPSISNLGWKKINNQVIKMWINNELRYHPEETPNVNWFAAKALMRDSIPVSKDLIRENIRKELQFETIKGLNFKFTEEQLLKAYDVAETLLGDSSLMDTLKLMIRDRFKGGEFDREEALKQIWESTLHQKDPNDLTESNKAFAKFLKKYPDEKFRDSYVQWDMFNHWYTGNFRALTYDGIMKRNDYSTLLEYLPHTPYSYLATYFWHCVMIPYERGDVKPDFIYPIARKIRDEIMGRGRAKADKVWSPNEWKEKKYSDYLMHWLDYAKILNDINKPQESLALCDTLSLYYGVANAEFNHFYMTMLNKCGRSSNEILTNIKAAINKNTASPEMLAFLKNDYVKNHNGEQGYEAYLQNLKSASQMEAQKAQVLKKLIKTPAKPFAFDKLEGGRIDMAKDLKGKIVVIDLWATWCGPCKAAMPGMQMAVNKYKDDKNVKFLFLSTMEQDKNFVGKIKDFIRQKEYNFQVVLDEPNKESGLRDLAYSTWGKTFQSSGIPWKLIFDREGNVRWMSTGYFGSPSALCDETSYVIDYLEAEK